MAAAHLGTTIQRGGQKHCAVLSLAVYGSERRTLSLAVYGSERRTLSYKYAVYTLYVDP